VVELGVGCRTCGRLWLMGLLIVAVLVVIIFVDSPVRDFFFHFFFLVVSAFFLFSSRDIMNITVACTEADS
jgi:hypothetical protein